MKIAIYPGTFLPTIGGAEIASHNIAKILCQMGHDVYVIVSDKRALNLQKEYKDVPYKIITQHPLRIIGLIRKAETFGINLKPLLWLNLLYLQVRYKFDVYHFNMIAFQALYSIPFLNRMKVPSVVTCQGADIQILPEINYGYRLKKDFENYFKRVIPHSTFVTAIGHSIQKDFIDAGVSPKKISIVPNGMHLSNFSKVVINKTEVRKTLGWPLDKKIIITVGRNHPKKGYRFIPEVLKHMVASRPQKDFLWIVIGKGCQGLDKIAEEMGVQDCLLIQNELGMNTAKEKTLNLPTVDLISAYKAADFFAMPTLLEGLPLVIPEAFAAGLSVVTTNVPGAKDVVTHNKTGLLSEAYDWKAFASNMLTLLDDPQKAQELKQGAEKELGRYSWDEITRQYESVYKAAKNFDWSHP